MFTLARKYWIAILRQGVGGKVARRHPFIVKRIPLHLFAVYLPDQIITVFLI
jgi:hypothetical protein